MESEGTNMNAAPDTPDSFPRSQDIAVRPLLLVIIGLALLIGLALAVNVLLFDWFEAREAARAQPVPFESARPNVPVPSLQIDPAADLAELRAEMDTRLSTYGWVDAEHDRVRIPIERAIELAARNGLPDVSPEDTQP